MTPTPEAALLGAIAPAAVRWWHRRMVAFDTETTGVDPETARIVSACIVGVGGGMLPEAHKWIIDPEVEIPAEAAAIHGITTERARAEGQPCRQAVRDIARTLNSMLSVGAPPLVIFNASYDLTVLDREMRRLLSLALNVNGYVVDPFVLDKHIDPYRKGSRKLAAMCEHYKARLDGAHDASFDAFAAARVAYRIGQRSKEIGGADLGVLHASQVKWFAEQAASLEAYFRKTDPKATCSREWPMRAWRPA